MNCPKCNAEMESGEVSLEAGGMSMMSFAAINFGTKRLWKESYVPFSWLIGKKNTRIGHRCKKCHALTIEFKQGVQ